MMKISQVKSTLQLIITKLKELQTHRDNLVQNNSASTMAEINKCKRTLEEAFASIEPKSIQKAVAAVKKRKNKRIRRTQWQKARSNRDMSSNTSLSAVSNSAPTSDNKPLATSNEAKLQSAIKNLDTIKSLEELHQLRGGGDACELEELNSLQNIWQSTADKLEAEENPPRSVEAQWDQVLFGGSSEIETKSGMGDLIERRGIWDSYLVSGDDSTGSHIPIGWVYPKEDARPEWKLFRL